MDTHLKARNLLVNYLSYSTKIKGLSVDKIEILHMECCDAIIYNLRTIIKTNKSSEECFRINEQPRQSSYPSHVNSSSKTYPCEFSTYNLSSVKNKTCYKCHGSKYLTREYCHLNDEIDSTDKPAFSYINSETGEILHENRSKKSIHHDSCKVTCNVCDGTGKLNQFKKIILVEDCLYDVRVKCNQKEVPLKNILKNKGNLIVDQTSKKLSAITTFPDDEVFDISDDLLKRHETRLKNSINWELVNQTHQLIVIPISKFTAKYKQKTIDFYIFTDTNDIYLNKKNPACSLL